LKKKNVETVGLQRSVDRFDSKAEGREKTERQYLVQTRHAGGIETGVGEGGWAVRVEEKSAWGKHRTGDGRTFGANNNDGRQNAERGNLQA